MARLLQVDRIIGVYLKTEFCGLHFFKNFHNFTAVSRFVLLHLVPQAQLILRYLIRSKILGFSSVPAGPLISDSFLVWKSYSSAEANFSQDILVQGGFYSIELVLDLRESHHCSKL